MKTHKITVNGRDKIGIIAAICNFLSKNNVNILDINQSVTKDIFHMVMIVDITDALSSESELSADLKQIEKQLEMEIKFSDVD